MSNSKLDISSLKNEEIKKKKKKRWWGNVGGERKREVSDERWMSARKQFVKMLWKNDACSWSKTFTAMIIEPSFFCSIFAEYHSNGIMIEQTSVVSLSHHILVGPVNVSLQIIIALCFHVSVLRTKNHSNDVLETLKSVAYILETTKQMHFVLMNDVFYHLVCYLLGSFFFFFSF